MRKAYKARSVQFNAKARLQSKFQCNSLLQNAWIQLHLSKGQISILKSLRIYFELKWIDLYETFYTSIQAILATSNE